MLLDHVDTNAAAAVRRELETVSGNRKMFWMESSKMVAIETFKNSYHLLKKGMELIAGNCVCLKLMKMIFVFVDKQMFHILISKVRINSHCRPASNNLQCLHVV